MARSVFRAAVVLTVGATTGRGYPTESGRRRELSNPASLGLATAVRRVVDVRMEDYPGRQRNSALLPLADALRWSEKRRTAGN
jgi:hypothetical protein